MEQREWDAVVIGGGFFGASLGLLLKEALGSVLVLERGGDLLERASYNNQARIHAGYHYPRSLMTAVRSQINFPRFVKEFPECTRSDFENYYAIGSVQGKVSSDQFRLFMERVGAPLSPAPESIRGLFNPDRIEAVFTARESAFDAGILRRIMRERLAAAGIQVACRSTAERLISIAADGLSMECLVEGEPCELKSKWVFNCTYSQINRLRHRSGLPLIPLKHEMTEMALVEPPAELAGIAVTVMCGPFFSLMPFPDRKLWSLSHVRYTPHHSWQDREGIEYRDAYEHFERWPKQSNGTLMIRDSARYMSAMAGCRQHGSLWEIKTVLPQSELDDGRPILFHREPSAPTLVTVMGGKLDNIYDIAQELVALELGTSSK